MRFALSTGSLYTQPLETVFSLAAKVGFDGIEVMVNEKEESRDTNCLREYSRRYDLPIVSIHEPLARHRRATKELELETTLELAQQVGAELVVTHLPYFFDRESLDRMLALRPGQEKRYGVRVGVENMGAITKYGIRIPRINWFAGNSVKFLSTHKNLVFDTTHAGSLGWDILKALKRLSGIIHVHLSDFDGRLHRLPGRGLLPLARFLSMLHEKRFGGAVVLEADPEALQPFPFPALKEAFYFMRRAMF